MIRAAALLVLTLTVFGCKHDAQSQQTKPPQRVEVTDSTHLNDAITRGRHTAITRAVEAVSPAVVSVNVTEVQRVRYRDPFSDFFNDPFFEHFFGQRRPRTLEREVKNLGSGFVISPDGYIVTNDHVAGNATEITVFFPDGRSLDADLIGTDPASDIALLKVEADEPLPYLAFSDSPHPIVGEWIVALGNPFGLFEAAEPTVTVGVVSAVDRDLQVSQGGHIYRDMIQTDAAINRGNSGGPLVNALGEVIGVNTAIYSESGGSIGIGFAVPAAKVQRILKELRERGSVDRSYYTGLYVMDLNQRIAQALGLERPRGAFVRDINPNSPGDQAGVLPYDVIVSIEGEAITNREDYVARIYDFRPGDRIQLGVIREGERMSLEMRIGRQEG